MSVGKNCPERNGKFFIPFSTHRGRENTKRIPHEEKLPLFFVYRENDRADAPNESVGPCFAYRENRQQGFDKHESL